MKMEWRNCFLCLRELEGRRTKLSDFKQAVKCLLNNSTTDDPFLRSLFEDSEENVRDKVIPPEACERCHAELSQIKRLQMELEVIQMKMIDYLRRLRTTVVQNSKVHGTNDVTKVCLTLFEECLQNQEKDGKDCELQKKLLDKLDAFQTAVYEAGLESIQIPLVYLKAFSSRAVNNLLVNSKCSSRDKTVVKTQTELKTEEDPNESQDNFADLETFLSFESADSPPSVSTGRRTRKRRKISYAPAKKRRAASKPKSANTPGVLPRYSKRPSFSSSFEGFSGKGKRDVRRRFSCSLCPFYTHMSWPFENHVRDHEATFPEKSLSCSSCPQQFATSLGLELHTSFHSGFIKYTCDHCSVRVCPLDMIEHVKTHMDKVFPCPNCSYCSSSREKFHNHLTKHKGSQGGATATYPCDLCPRTFPTLVKLQLHLDKTHEALSKYTCNVEGCGRSYNCQWEINSHMKLHMNPVVCPVCEKHCLNKQKLEQHMENHKDMADRTRAHKCSQCGEAFLTGLKLDAHKREVHGVKYNCELCGVEYKTKQSLMDHNNLTHDDIIFKCSAEGCGQLFGSSQRLKLHTRRNHANRPKKICTQCGAEFKSIDTLKSHMASHEDKREHVCSVCGKGFNLRKFLKQHMNIHKNEKKYCCETCGSRFNQQAALYLHKKRHNIDLPSSSGVQKTQVMIP